MNLSLQTFPVHSGPNHPVLSVVTVAIRPLFRNPSCALQCVSQPQLSSLHPSTHQVTTMTRSVIQVLPSPAAGLHKRLHQPRRCSLWVLRPHATGNGVQWASCRYSWAFFTENIPSSETGRQRAPNLILEDIRKLCRLCPFTLSATRDNSANSSSS